MAEHTHEADAIVVAAHVDGRMIGIAERAGSHAIGRDRMWQYVEGNPDLTGKSIRAVLRARIGSGVPPPVEAFMRQGPDFAVATECRRSSDE